METTWWVADTHFDHPNIIIHCKRPYLRPGDLNSFGKWATPEIRQARTDEMNADMAGVWNATVAPKDTVNIIGDFAWKNHRRWINELNGKKVFLVGSHDKMPQDSLDLFKPDNEWEKDFDDTQERVAKTLFQFREVHHSLIRSVCGQWMHMYHWACSSWQGKPRGWWHIHGHVHGRRWVSLPGESAGGLVLDAGWDVFKRPVNFDEIREIMRAKAGGVGRRAAPERDEGLPDIEDK